MKSAVMDILRTEGAREVEVGGEDNGGNSV
jgi:hypothetical protein